MAAVGSAGRGSASPLRWRFALAVVCAAAFAATMSGQSAGSESTVIKETREAKEARDKEYRIKAAFLFNFTKFVEWPASSFAEADTPITIGVLGDDPFGATLDETVRGESVKERKLVVRRAQKAEELKDCQLVYVSPSERARVGEIIAALGSSPTLTVGDNDGFCQAGGVIQFYLEANKVRFSINQAVAQRLGLKLSSQLLSVGKAFVPDEPGKQP